MQLVKPSVEILNISSDDPIHTIAEAARVSHQAHGDNDEELVHKLLKWGHLSVLEHVNVTCKFVTDIKIAMALLRHRHISVTQESTRYCNYADQKKFMDGIQIVPPAYMATFMGYKQETDQEIWETCDEATYAVWESTIDVCQNAYNKLISLGVKAEIARSILPMCTKTETIITTNLREWMHIIECRTTFANHPDMMNLGFELKKALQKAIPIIFED